MTSMYPKYHRPGSHSRHQRLAGGLKFSSETTSGKVLQYWSHESTKEHLQERGEKNRGTEMFALLRSINQRDIPKLPFSGFGGLRNDRLPYEEGPIIDRAHPNPIDLSARSGGDREIGHREDAIETACYNSNVIQRSKRRQAHTCNIVEGKDNAGSRGTRTSTTGAGSSGSASERSSSGILLKVREQGRDSSEKVWGWGSFGQGKGYEWHDAFKRSFKAQVES
ncbi:hypothetical protein C8R45DRAFT_1152205 [Mycena sanguinolenta]|nr:hypothetical protein C8R45DRAFT_1152205 [Mycena sanguinolenta]